MQNNLTIKDKILVYTIYYLFCLSTLFYYLKYKIKDFILTVKTKKDRDEVKRKYMRHQ